MKTIVLSLIKSILRALATIVLRRHHPQIIGITGSVGKTSTKEAIYTVLSQNLKEKVGKSYGNLNNEYGLPLAILGFKNTPTTFSWPFVLFWAIIKTPLILLSSYPLILVLEYAADKPGDIEYLTSFLKPRIGVVTRVGIAHTKFFKNLENIFEEKSKLISILPKDGFAVLNESDELVAKMAKETLAKIVWYESEGLDLPMRAAQAVGETLGITSDKIKNSLNDFQGIPGRLNIIKAENDIIIIDDSYNANPLSMKLALDFLREMKSETKDMKCRKISVLGDMLELGSFSPTAHQEIGKYARRYADVVVSVGKQSQKMAADYHFEDKDKALELLLKIIKKGDIILIKGSHGIHLEEIVEKLVEKLSLH